MKGAFGRKTLAVFTLAVVLALTLWVFSTRFPLSPPDGRAEGESADEWVERKLQEMSVEEKVGQLFMVGFHNGDQPALEMNEQAITLIEEYHAGGVILFDRNVDTPEQVARLNRDMQAKARESSTGVPLFISIDQEGGKVLRIRDGVTLFPGNMALGAAGDPELSSQTGKVMGKELRLMGINMNLAPSLDVNNNDQNPIIGVRSFSGDPNQVAELGVAQMKGFREGGVLSVVKHFPGHGDTDSDSHVDLPTVAHSMERLDQVELKPFKKALDAGVDAVMSAHITFPAIDDTPGLPGTLSPQVLTGLLREEWGYDGVIITDDMEMGAIVDNFGAGDAAVRAVEAGADILLVAHDWNRQKESIQAVIQAVEAGEISEKRIDQSVRRILQLKAKPLGKASILDQSDLEPSGGLEELADPEHAELAARVAEEAVTLVRDPAKQLPLSPSQTPRMLILTPAHADEWERAFQGAGFDAEARSVPLQPDPMERQAAYEGVAAFDTVVVALSQAQMRPEQQELVTGLRHTGKPVIAVGLDTPYDVSVLPADLAYLTAYSSQPVSIRAAVDVLTGETEPKGTLPVEIPRLYPRGHSENGSPSSPSG
ncbi:beta-N-acetylhexosaminidase [Desmospora profundinema]|uniref:beta-N-acetylhexosaminidase n=1 Tax=Desmospora profundinema TaxID=1571184 RepID=A0ABU1ISK8_9BACL|nr:beta-N-acetylhexosaminidase [Desmospora profundinema]MDR6227433.1 beta-N-acetylhexosaminidase [Desmospora profundinema]